MNTSDRAAVHVPHQVHQQRNLLLHRRVIQHLRHLVGGAPVRLDAHELRVVHVLVGELGDAVRQRRRKQHAQALVGRRHAVQQEADVLDETEVEHAVGLVEHHHLNRAQVEDMLLVVIDDAPGRADEYVDAGLEHAALLLVASAAIHQPELEAGVPAEAARHPCGSAPRVRASAPASRRAGSSACAGAGGCFSRWLKAASRNAAVLPVPVWAWPATSWPASAISEGLGLDRRAKLEAGLAHAGQQRFRQVQTAEGGCPVRW